MPAPELPKQIWGGRIPLEIRLSPIECRAYDLAPPYIVLYPRTLYLPLLLKRLHAFFALQMIQPDSMPHEGWFSYEEVPLKWQHPVGLLFDLFSGTEHDATSLEPWKIDLHFTDRPNEQLIPLDAAGRVLHDAFINSVKEADYLRNGTAKAIMSLGKDDSTNLWRSVTEQNLSLFDAINQKFFGDLALRHVPIKIYLPSADNVIRTVQGLIAPGSNNDRQTLGSALNLLLPTVFPSRRSYMYAQAVLHGAIVPPSAPVEELLRAAAYPDGFLHVAVHMIG